MTAGAIQNPDDGLKWDLLARKKQELEVVRAFRVFRQNGIEPILIKGWASARCYPESRPRNWGDIDLAVSATDYPGAENLVRSGAEKGLVIDLHRELRHLDTLPWSELFSNSELVDLEGNSIRILAPEDHLRTVIIHWLNDGGAYKERLWDIYYAVENRPKNFDWDRCLNSTGKIRREWLVCTIMLAHRYLGLDISDLPLADDERGIPGWLQHSVEKEWNSELRLRPLHGSLKHPRLLGKQILKRIPGNPIQATIDMGGSFYHWPRIVFQIGSILKRIPPSARRIFNTLIGRPA